ncbi:MAG TPA: glycosyltransferase family 4 protein [Acinetobacter parvus]|jgi:glycosyltransferase involved in cell wall biosynthesis|uniref:glycosyltransferase family 4 protein n=1 Tax=Acinetobacter parvus TaxID=134533 RepID=UPI002C93C021|nr:glycosyltransferase family 4 protein [Acinetobacter parvus]HRM16175.1 glycosyltransferase family 4 protein [Acinetobacter parvus]
MSKILLLCTKYPSLTESDWLTSELAESLHSNYNYEVDVLLMDWKLDSLSEKYIRKGVNVSKFSLSKLFQFHLPIFLKWLIYSPIAVLFYWRLIFKKYQLVVAFSPCSASWFLCLISRLMGKQNLLIYWDFFPIHNQQIGMMSNGLQSKLLYFLEKKCVKNFDYIACMSPKNIDFFENYFGRVKSPTKLLEFPIWGTDTDVSKFRGLSIFDFYDPSNKYFVFGGQLIPGRGLDVAMEAALLAAKKDPSIRLLIFGTGILSQTVEEYSLKSSGVIRYCGTIERGLYKSILKDCIGGIVSTVPGVSVPTYPSKSLDYMMANLPILASVEDSTDFGDIIESNGAGIKCKEGDSESLSNAMYRIASDISLRNKMGVNSRKMYENRHQTIEVAKLIHDLIKEKYV